MILFFIAIFFNHQEFDHYESGCGAKKKKKKSQLDLYLEDVWEKIICKRTES